MAASYHFTIKASRKKKYVSASKYAQELAVIG
jgi:hypothetical protein